MVWNTCENVGIAEKIENFAFCRIYVRMKRFFVHLPLYVYIFSILIFISWGILFGTLLNLLSPPLPLSRVLHLLVWMSSFREIFSFLRFLLIFVSHVCATFPIALFHLFFLLLLLVICLCYGFFTTLFSSWILSLKKFVLPQAFAWQAQQLQHLHPYTFICGKLVKHFYSPIQRFSYCQ